MSRTGILWAATLSLLLSMAQTSTFAGSTPGQDISSCASVVWCEQTQLSSGASVSYVDPSGNPVEESSDANASVQAETSLSPIIAGPATSFVAPPTSAAVYFALSRSLYSGASMVGKCVKLVGRVRTIDGALYLDDGATLVSTDPASGRAAATPTLIPVHQDLLTTAPADGTLVTIQGVCRLESNGYPSLLPLSDSAIAEVQ